MAFLPSFFSHQPPLTHSILMSECQPLGTTDQEDWIVLKPTQNCSTAEVQTLSAGKVCIFMCLWVSQCVLLYTDSALGMLSSRRVSGHSGGGRLTLSGSTEGNPSLLFLETDVHSCWNMASFSSLMMESIRCWWTASISSCSSRSVSTGAQHHMMYILQDDGHPHLNAPRWKLTVVNLQDGWAGDCAKWVKGHTFEEAGVFWKGLCDHQCTQLLCTNKSMSTHWLITHPIYLYNCFLIKALDCLHIWNEE